MAGLSAQADDGLELQTEDCNVAKIKVLCDSPTNLDKTNANDGKISTYVLEQKPGKKSVQTIPVGWAIVKVHLLGKWPNWTVQLVVQPKAGYAIEDGVENAPEKTLESPVEIPEVSQPDAKPAPRIEPFEFSAVKKNDAIGGIGAMKYTIACRVQPPDGPLAACLYKRAKEDWGLGGQDSPAPTAPMQGVPASTPQEDAGSNYGG